MCANARIDIVNTHAAQCCHVHFYNVATCVRVCFDNVAACKYDAQLRRANIQRNYVAQLRRAITTSRNYAAFAFPMWKSTAAINFFNFFNFCKLAFQFFNSF